MNLTLSSELQSLVGLAEEVVEQYVAPYAEAVDKDCSWPNHSMQALATSGLLGLLVPKKFGGHGQGLNALARITETIAKVCPSSAMCFGMHCVATAVISAKATPYHEEHYLREIARGKHISTLAITESGTGSHLYLTETQLKAEGIHYVVNGTKQFVTNGGHANSYVISTIAGKSQKNGVVSCFIVDHEAAGLEWLEPWRGFGMRGNASRGLGLKNVRLPKANLLGDEGDQSWYLFEVIAPYFLIAMAGNYLGIAQAALNIAHEHLKQRRYTHTDGLLRDVETLQTKFADMWRETEKTRRLVEEAVMRGDAGSAEALPVIFACKIDAAELAVHITNEAMTICGGSAYRENSKLAQLLRDARAGHVMGPTTDMLRVWLGKHLLGLSIP